MVIIKRALDVGARSLLIPFVQNAEEARRAVAATRYPPLGIRGVAVTPRANDYGRIQNYHRNAHLDTCVLVQLETKDALKEIEAVAAVEGVDGIFIGPSDLAAASGHLANPKHPDVQAAIKEAAQRIRAAGKSAGFLTGNLDDVEGLFEIGYDFTAVGSDVGILARGAEPRRRASGNESGASGVSGVGGVGRAVCTDSSIPPQKTVFSCKVLIPLMRA